MTMRKISVLTTTRADYSLLFWLVRSLCDTPDIELQFIVSGTHFSPQFGHTIDEIEKDGLPIAARIPLQLEDDSTIGVTHSLSAAVAVFGDAFEKLQSDLLVLLGDRYEILAAAQAAMVARLPIAHIHGGETSEGAMDEAIRHAVTKMAHLHFVSAEEHRRRVIQLGEQPQRVWNVGAPALDNIARLNLHSRADLERTLNFSFGELNFLITYHPVTLKKQNEAKDVLAFLTMLVNMGAHIILTGVNADMGGQILHRTIEDFAAAHRQQVLYTPSLGRLNYLSVLAQMDAVIGNSSSGLVEAPTLGVPTVNIGERQKGRLQAPSVIQCAMAQNEIKTAIEKALSPAHKKLTAKKQNPYGRAGAAEKIATIICEHPLDALLMKSFYNFDFKAE